VHEGRWNFMVFLNIKRLVKDTKNYEGHEMEIQLKDLQIYLKIVIL
jgi:hypothetical protein